MVNDYEMKSLRKRVGWAIWSRFGFLVMLAGGLILVSQFYEQALSISLLWATTYGIVFSLLSRVLMRVFRDQESGLHSLLWAQILVDIVLASYFVMVTGGLDSAFILMFGMAILIGGLVLMTRGAIVASVISMFAFMSIVLWSNGLDSIVAESSLFVRFVFFSSSIILVGGLVAVLARNREVLERSLEQTHSDLQDVSLLQEIILEHMPSGIFFVSPDMRVQYSNPMADSILGCDAKMSLITELGFSLSLLHDSTHEVEVFTKSGEKRGLRCQSISLGERGWLVLFSDVTKLRDLEREFNMKARLASVGQFAAGLAHEIKNPLASLSGSIQLMKDEIPEDAKHSKLMEIVLRETDRLDELLNNFLYYAKPSMLRLEEVQVSKLVSEIAELLENARERGDKNIKVEINIDDQLKLRCDAGNLRQIFWNLVRNAVAAIESEGIVSVSAKKSGEFIRCEVRDTGAGMTEETKDKVFEPFFTLKAAGTGLGLSLVYQMVKAHEGRIGVESTLGEGSLFWFELKAKGPSNDKVSYEERRSQSAA